MNVRRTHKSGFTLVEILIVVIILGILAAIVIPQFTSASEDARKNSVTSQLQTLRSQIELYKLQHRDTLPDLLTNWTQMTQKTDEAGAVSATGAFGPYLQSIPANPLNGQSGVVNGTDTTFTGAATTGFIYDYGTGGNGTGKIWATNKTTTVLYNEATGVVQ